MSKDQISYKNRQFFIALTVIVVILAFDLASAPEAATPERCPLLFHDASSMRHNEYPDRVSETGFLPLSVPETDHAPYFEGVTISAADSPASGVCFSGSVKDDIRIQRLKIIVKTNAGYGFEVANTPLASSSVNLSEYCIENIDRLLSFKKGEYEIILTVKDSADNVVSKNFFISLPLKYGCQQDMYGGQCVNYVRSFFGDRRELMPGLCIYGDCGAYHAWETWDLGYGKGRLPKKKSILVIDRDPLLFGHVAVVMDWKKNADGNYLLIVHESNWDRDELIDCNVRYTYYPKTAEVTREGKTKVYNVAGFIYSDNKGYLRPGD